MCIWTIVHIQMYKSIGNTSVCQWRCRYGSSLARSCRITPLTSPIGISPFVQLQEFVLYHKCVPRPAYQGELTALENEIEQLWDQYVLRYRCVEALKHQLSTLESAQAEVKVRWSSPEHFARMKIDKDFYYRRLKSSRPPSCSSYINTKPKMSWAS